MQGDSLAVVAYGIVIIPLIKCLKLTYPDIMHIWYADNSGALGMFNNLKQYFNFFNATARLGGITPIPLKAYWVCI